MHRPIELQSILKFALNECLRGFNGELLLNEDEIYKYMLFYVTAELKQLKQQEEGRTLSILQFLLEEQGKKGAISTTELINDDNLRYEYDRLHDRYTKINFGHKKELKEKRRIEKSSAERFKGNKIYEFQIDELKVLNEKYNDKTYKRIRNNNLHLIKFEEYESFVYSLKEIIEKNDGENKNIELYKLEKRLNFELIKKILKVKHEIKQTSNIILEDLIVLTLLPEIEGRQKCVDYYKEFVFNRRKDWRLQVLKTAEFIRNTIGVAKDLIMTIASDGNEIKVDEAMEESRKIYSSGEYLNEYTLGKDFAKKDFSSLMKMLRDQNEQVIEELNKDK